MTTSTPTLRMPAVSNTSPIANLAVIGRLELLREQLRLIQIPPAVHAELLRLPHSNALATVEAALAEKWIEVRPPASGIPGELKSLDPGEAQAIALALEVDASILVIDETIGRRIAAKLKLQHVGLLGVLRHARLSDRIPSLAAEIGSLREEAHFFISSDLERRLLASVGEQVG